MESDLINDISLAEKRKHITTLTGVKKQDRVIFCLRRSVEVVAIILGILKADAIYVPIDCKAPLDRWQDIFIDCSPVAVICDNKNLDNANQVMNRSKRYSLDISTVCVI